MLGSLRRLHKGIILPSLSVADHCRTMSSFCSFMGAHAPVRGVPLIPMAAMGGLRPLAPSRLPSGPGRLSWPFAPSAVPPPSSHSRLHSSVALAERREESPSVSPEELLPWTVAGIPDNLAASLCGRSFAAPTEIQRLSLPFLRTQERSDVLLAAETGTGKTLAYLLPLMLSLKALELGPSPAGPSRPGRPRALVLAPTRELAAQIAREAKLLAHTLKLRCALAAGTRKKAVELAGLTCPDLVVGTPDRVLWHAEQGRLRLGDVRRAVLDEADTMFDPGFGPSVSKVLFILGRRADADAARHGGAAQSALVPRAREPGSDGRSDGVREACPVTLVAATVSPPIRRLLNSSFPHLRALETRALHRGVAASRHVFEPVPAQGDKLALLLGLAERGAAEQRKTLVFANTLTSCRAVAATLQEAGLDALEFSGRADRAAREQALRAFGLGGAAGEAEVEVGVEEEEWEDGDGDASSGDAPALAKAWTAQRNPILVCSDLAARGLDLAAVDHVINFDFPLNVVDYLHRAGRTARAGRKGTVTSLVGRRDRAFASLVERALRTGAPLDGVVRPGVPAGQRGGEKTARPVAGATVGRSGGERARFGGGRSKFGGERPKFGGERPKFGGGRSKFGGERSKFGGQRAKSGGERSVFDDERARPGGERSKFGGQRAKFGGERSVFDDERARPGGERSKFGGQRAKFGGERSVFDDERARPGGERSKFGGQRARPGGEKSRFGGERSTFGSKRARFGEERGRPGGGRSRLGDNRGRSGDERGRPGENRARAAAWSAQDSASRGWTSVGQQPAADAMDAPKVRARRMRPPSFKK